MKQFLPESFWCLCLLSLVFSCAAPGNDSKIGASSNKSEKFDLVALKDSIEKANERYVQAVTTGDTIAAADNFTSDAKIMAPNMPPITSRKDIIRFAGENFRTGISAKIQTTNVWGTADLVAEEGTYIIYNKSGKELDHGKFLGLWKNEAGRWRLFRDMFSSDLPVASQ